MITIEKEIIMEEMLQFLKVRMKFFADVTTKDLANIYLGELHGFEICFNIVGARGIVNSETIKISTEFRKELENARQILIKKFESATLQ